MWCIGGKYAGIYMYISAREGFSRFPEVGGLTRNFRKARESV